MVNSREQIREAVQTTITHIAGLEYFENKVEVMKALLDIEWSLRESEESLEEVTGLEEEFLGGRERPWSD
jgi:hypothetical protein